MRKTTNRIAPSFETAFDVAIQGVHSVGPRRTAVGREHLAFVGNRTLGEFPGVYGRRSVHRSGPIPPPLAAVMRPHVSAHAMAMQDALSDGNHLWEQDNTGARYDGPSDER